MPVSSTRIERSTSSPKISRTRHDHVAALGELDGIADEVGDDLADAPDVADENARHPGVDADDEFQILVGSRPRHQEDDVLDRLGEAEALRIDGHLPGIDLREVEDVVDDGEKGVFRISG